MNTSFLIANTKSFQSTPPKRSATHLWAHLWAHLQTQFQSTQPKRAATEAAELRMTADNMISIHAAQEGCDLKMMAKRPTGKQFQSTQPKRAATRLTARNKKPEGISIHAAQEGCDSASFFLSPPAPIFQSTQPKRAATKAAGG